MCTNFLTHSVKLKNAILPIENMLQQQIRSTYILKRKNSPRLNKKGGIPKSLRSKHYVYELVRNTSIEKQSNIDVILTSYVEGVGSAGQMVSLRPTFAYNNLLLTGLAVYPTPENVEKYKDHIHSDTEVKYSSVTAALTVKTLSRIVLSVVMNKDNLWTIQPWHIKTSFRKCGYVVPEEAIILPEKPIQGPDMDNEGKEFYVTVTINNSEKVNVRCRLHHWSTDITERLPYLKEFWKIRTEPIFLEQADVLKQMPTKEITV